MSDDIRATLNNVEQIVREHLEIIVDGYTPRIEELHRNGFSDQALSLYYRMLEDMRRAIEPLFTIRALYGSVPMIRVLEPSEQDRQERRVRMDVWLGTGGEA